VAGLAFLVLLGLAARPYLQTTRAAVNKPTQGAMADWQRADHLPVQPTRLYWELSLHWVFNPLKVLMPIALALLGLGAAKAVYDVVVHPFHVADDTVLVFVSGLIIATLALLADLIVRSRSDG
jgi:hypothetical protein